MNNDELRPTPSLSDPEAVRVRLQEWLNEGLFAGKSLEVTEFRIPESTGMSNITVLMEARCQENGQTRTLPMVARLQAMGQKLSFPDYDLPMQYAIMETLGRIPGMAAPGLVVLEPTGDVLGTPFYIMHRTEGLIPPDMPPYHMDGWLVESTPAERERVWWSGVDMMAHLHCQPIDQPPLAGFIAEHRFPRGLSEQLDYWAHYMAWGLEGDRNLQCEAALDWLRANAPQNEPQALCWGDSRMANVIFRPDKTGVAALLDWEMLVLGNPLQDIAWWIFMDELFSHGIGVPRLEGFPPREATLKHWSDKTGLGTGALHYYLVFAGLRISLILARMSLITGDRGMVKESFASHYMMKIMSETA